MLSVLTPARVGLRRGYSNKHKGYDHSLRRDKNGKIVKDITKQDKNYYASIYGKIVRAKNSETKNWTNTGELTTKDYGNYGKIKGEIDGETTYQLGAHFEPGSVLPVGTEVKAGQVIAQIGDTGNSTGPHCHTEYRDKDNHNFPVEFVDKVEEKNGKMYTKTQEEIIRESYLAITGEWPSDDEIKARLQKNENPIELIEDLLKGDARSKPRWLEIWEISEDKDPTVENYRETFQRLKEILKIPVGANTEEVLGKVQALLDRALKLEEAQIPKIVYKHEGKDYEKAIKFLNLLLIIEKQNS